MPPGSTVGAAGLGATGPRLPQDWRSPSWAGDDTPTTRAPLADPGAGHPQPRRNLSGTRPANPPSQRGTWRWRPLAGVVKPVDLVIRTPTRSTALVVGALALGSAALGLSLLPPFARGAEALELRVHVGAGVTRWTVRIARLGRLVHERGAVIVKAIVRGRGLGGRRWRGLGALAKLLRHRSG